MGEKTVAQKLLVKPGTAVWLSDPDRADLLGALPEGVRLINQLADAGVGIVIAASAAEVAAQMAARRDELAALPVLWFLYPKGGRADINRDTLWRQLAPHGIRPITQVAVDDVWSALRFRPLKDDEAPFQRG